jgi:hypothetical protein
MNSRQNSFMVGAVINIAACAIGVHAGNYGLATLNAGMALSMLAVMLLPSNPK